MRLEQHFQAKHHPSSSQIASTVESVASSSDRSLFSSNASKRSATARKNRRRKSRNKNKNKRQPSDRSMDDQCDSSRSRGDRGRTKKGPESKSVSKCQGFERANKSQSPSASNLTPPPPPPPCCFASTHQPAPPTTTQTIASKIKVIREFLFREKDRVTARRDALKNKRSASGGVSISILPLPSFVPDNQHLRGTNLSFASDSDEESPTACSESVADSKNNTDGSEHLIADQPAAGAAPYHQQLEDWRKEYAKKRKSTMRRIEKLDRALRDHEEKVRASMRTLQVVDENESLNQSLHSDFASIATESTTSKDGASDIAPREQSDDRVLEKTITTSNDSAPDIATIEQSDDRVMDQRNQEFSNIVHVSHLPWSIPRLNRTGFYSGAALDGTIPHGQGIVHFSDGAVYTGSFANGQLHGGEATLKRPSGATYVGEFCRNQRHGHGEEIFRNGSRYIGRYEKGRPHGFGVMYRPNGKVFHLGGWRRGSPLKRLPRTGGSKTNDETSALTDDSFSFYSNRTSISSSTQKVLSLGHHFAFDEDGIRTSHNSRLDDLSNSTDSSCSSNEISIYDSRYDGCSKSICY